MGENIIKARQTAKIATSSEWEDSTLPLKRGELTINETTGEMRFGDGVDTFNNSPKVKTVPLSHSSSSTEYGVGNGENYGHVKLSDSTDSTSDVSDGTAATPAAVKAAYDLANSKAGKENDSGGFMGGRSANVIDCGGAVGAYSYTESGGAVGDTAKSSTGGAVGEVAESTGGAAVGYATITSNGVAVGMNATTVDSDGNGIDAIQLGTGTNSTEKTIQVYNYQLMDANGKIPADRLSPHASTSNTYGVGDSANYGHLKLSDSTSSTSRATGGVAATPYAVKAAYEYAESVEMEITDMKDNAVLYTVNTFTSNSGSNYVATVDGLTEYKSGMLLIFSPNVTSTTKQPYLNINGLGNTRIVRRFTAGMSSYSEQYINDNFYVGFSYLLQYDGNSFIDVTRPQTSWEDLEGKPTSFTPSSHASASDIYGLADASNYGHVRLSDNTTSNATAPNGIAATPAAVKAAYDLANSKAPTFHASTATTYGVGNSSSYGHLKLSASTSSTSGTSSGIAATPSAVKAAYDLANGKAPTSHASSSTTYGIGNGLYYGHVSLSDSLDMGTDADYGIAATPMAVKTVYMQLLSQLADKYNAAILVDTATSISTGKYQNYSSPFEDADGNKLKVVIYAPNLTSIAGLSIRDTDDIVAIIAPQLKSIATQAFWGCHYLQFLYIPSTITSIGSNAFAYCDHLKSIYVDKEEGSISGAPWQTTGVSVENVYWLGGA